MEKNRTRTKQLTLSKRDLVIYKKRKQDYENGNVLTGEELLKKLGRIKNEPST